MNVVFPSVQISILIDGAINQFYEHKSTKKINLKKNEYKKILESK